MLKLLDQEFCDFVCWFLSQSFSAHSVTEWYLPFIRISSRLSPSLFKGLCLTHDSYVSCLHICGYQLVTCVIGVETKSVGEGGRGFTRMVHADVLGDLCYLYMLYRVVILLVRISIRWYASLICLCCPNCLTLILLMWRIGWAHNNAKNSGLADGMFCDRASLIQ